MQLLGIESSCDETAAAVVADGRLVLSNVIASQFDLHAEYGGVVPELASRAHAERILPIVRCAMKDAGVSLHAIDGIAVGYRPGLIGSLVVGVAAAKALAWALEKPLIGVDHIHAHLYAGFLAEKSHDGAPPPVLMDSFPALGLVVSGGHTALYRCESPIDLTRLGGTIDDALGEAYDKAATILGLPYPGGPHLDRLAQHPDADERAHDFPISRLRRDSLDFSFSGLKTSLLYAVRGQPIPGGTGPGGQFQRDHTWLSEGSRVDFAASFQRAAVKAVLLKLERALDHVPACRALLIGGGVSANSRLRAELTAFARDNHLQLHLPAMHYCLDNAAMIAGLAHHLLAAGRVSSLDLAAAPTTAA